MHERGASGAFPWLGPVLAAAAFAAVFAAFAWQLVVYGRNVRAASGRDLQSRAELAAIVLAEPLRTLDFKSVHAFAGKCRADGLRLRVCPGAAFSVSDDGGRGGCLYDTAGGADVACVFRTARSGDYVIGVGRPVREMLAPFLKSLVVIVLAGLLGVVGVVLFFFATWRQRVRIRALARMERERRAFVADVSHEIKTPLTGILGAADLMAEEAARTGGGGTMATWAGMIRKEGARLNGLVQQILDLSRLERAGEVLNPEDVDVADLVRETVARFAPRAASAGAALVVADGSAASLPWRGDAALLSQALANLVENAIRHAGAATIRVSCARDGQGLRLVVEDDGRGVPPGEAARIFERFHRVDPARAAETGGAGLGLAIVRRILRLHGGDVVCEAVSPHGARFVCRV